MRISKRGIQREAGWWQEVEPLKQLRLELYDKAFGAAKMIFTPAREGIESGGRSRLRKIMRPASICLLRALISVPVGPRYKEQASSHKHTLLVLERAIGSWQQTIIEDVHFMLVKADVWEKFKKIDTVSCYHPKAIRN